MLKLTKKVEYALISLVHLSEQEDDVFFPASKIAEKYTIPNEILAKILQQLSSLNMIKSIKGPKGGYKISCKINNINIFEFIEMIEGPIGIVDCVVSNDCNAIDCCSIKDPMTKINSQIIETLKRITLDQLR
tara:strand:- start:1101 stop:1496 length:396 start_codon:yes stop_codon:yes gene_type:complete